MLIRGDAVTLELGVIWWRVLAAVAVIVAIVKLVRYYRRRRREAERSPQESIRARFQDTMDMIMPWEDVEVEEEHQHDLPDELLEELMKPREDFRALLFHYLNRSGRTNPEVYRAAQIDRKLFSAICTKPHYQPSRGTVIRLALALQLTLPEAMEFMERAGYALSSARPSDLVVTYYISRGVYDLMTIEAALYEIGEHL
ncbi:hypothetical protein [Mitsuokella jalaludinii]|uniref:hypothetical protein n=1 Tax=Mitsuokella jalaludinii TaxID=187979 RepID=UPI0026774A03|nr:hypothetical protein [uncultured Mitsuokella sp.]